MSEKEPDWTKRAAARTRAAAKANAKKNPLFAEVDPVAQVDPQEEFRRWRRNKAEGVERGHRVYSPAITAMENIRERALFRLACNLIGTETAQRLSDYAHQTYPGVSYWVSFWCDVLSGSKRVVYAWQRVEDQSLSCGIRLVEDGSFPPEGWQAPIARDALLEAFEIIRADYGNTDPPDDSGLSKRLDALFARLTNQPENETPAPGK